MKTRITQLQVICAEVLKSGAKTPAQVANEIDRPNGNVHRALRCMESNGYAVAIAGEPVSYVLTKKGEIVVLTSEASRTLTHKRYAKDNPLPLFAATAEEAEINTDDILFFDLAGNLLIDEPDIVIDDKPVVVDLTNVSIRTVPKITVGAAVILRDGDNQITLSAEDARDLYKKLQPYVGFGGSMMGDAA